MANRSVGSISGSLGRQASFQTEANIVDHERRPPGPATRHRPSHHTVPVPAFRTVSTWRLLVKHDHQLAVYKYVFTAIRQNWTTYISPARRIIMWKATEYFIRRKVPHRDFKLLFISEIDLRFHRPHNRKIIGIWEHETQLQCLRIFTAPWPPHSNNTHTNNFTLQILMLKILLFPSLRNNASED